MTGTAGVTDELPPLDSRAVAVLARFSESLSDHGFDPGCIVEPPRLSDGAVVCSYARLSENAEAFVAAVSSAGWVRPFKWSEWAHSPAGQRYALDISAVAGADVSDLSRLLTTVILEERFVTGALLEAFEIGPITAISRRAAVLLDEAGD